MVVTSVHKGQPTVIEKAKFQGPLTLPLDFFSLPSTSISIKCQGYACNSDANT